MARATKANRSFTPELFTFLRELRQNNDREWFKANKERYERPCRSRRSSSSRTSRRCSRR